MKLTRVNRVVGATLLMTAIAASQVGLPRLTDMITDWLFGAERTFEVTLAQYCFVMVLAYIGYTTVAILIYFLPAFVYRMYAAIRVTRPDFARLVTVVAVLAGLFFLPLGIEFACQSASIGSVTPVWGEMYSRAIRAGALSYWFVAFCALCEEIIYRYLTLYRLCQVMPAVVAVLLCSVAFGVVHYFNIPGAQVISISTDGALYCLVFLISCDFARGNKWSFYRAFGLFSAAALHSGVNIKKMLIDGFPDPPFLEPSNLSLVFDRARNMLPGVDLHLHLDLAIRLLVCVSLFVYYFHFRGKAIGRQTTGARSEIGDRRRESGD